MTDLEKKDKVKEKDNIEIPDEVLTNISTQNNVNKNIDKKLLEKESVCPKSEILELKIKDKNNKNNNIQATTKTDNKNKSEKKFKRICNFFGNCCIKLVTKKNLICFILNLLVWIFLTLLILFYTGIIHIPRYRELKMNSFLSLFLLILLVFFILFY